MLTAPYPEFSPPETLAATPHREWSRWQAKAYFDWLMGCMPERVAGLCRYLGVSREPGQDPRDFLVAVSHAVAELLRDERFSVRGPDGYELTVEGHAVAADMGLLTAQCVLDTVGDAISWRIQSRPKRHMSYNLPVLAPVGPDSWDPIGVSITDAKWIVAGRGSGDAWVRVFDFCRSKAATP